MDALFGFVAAIAALKINVKVYLSSLHFSQNFNIRIKYEFACTKVRHVPRKMLKTKGDRFGGFRGRPDQPIVHE